MTKKKFVIKDHIKGLIFDCDGTLADTMPLHYKAYREALGDNADCFSEDMFFNQAGVPAPQVMALLKKRYDLDIDPEQVGREKKRSTAKPPQH